MHKRFPKGWWAEAQRRAERDAFDTRFRRQILGQLHSGRLTPGDRLPSIRETARQSGVDHRVVAKTYHKLAEAGLIEIRPSGGAFVLQPAGDALVPDEGTTDLLAQALFGAWERRISSSMLELLSRWTTAGLRCGCVESNDDHMVALTSELEEDFSLQAVPIRVPSPRGQDALAPERLEEVDLVVASMFHVEAARTAAEQTKKPMVVATFHPEFTREIDRRLRAGPITAVHVDPEYAARGREYFSVTAHHDRAQFVVVDQLQEHAVDLDAENVLITRAARRKLGFDDYHLIPEPPVLSPDTARDLSRAILEVSLR